MSIVTPPLILISHAIRKQPISIRTFFRKYNLWGLGGTVASVPIGAYVMKDEPESAMAARRGRLVSTFDFCWPIAHDADDVSSCSLTA
jgi:hypothetical protein